MIAHLKNPGMYSSVSAFAPICNPTAVPWGEKVSIFNCGISLTKFFARLLPVTLGLLMLARPMMLPSWLRTIQDQSLAY